MREILAGAVLLDKLPWWLAVPLGLGAGAGIGYWVASTELAPAIWLVAAIAPGAVLWLGLSAPRPSYPDRRSSARDEGAPRPPPADTVL